MNIRKYILIAIILLMPAVVRADDSGNSSGYAWAEKLGWLHFSGADAPVDYGLNITSDQATGYVWSEKAGWISLNCLNALTCGDLPYGVVSDGAGNLSGYAWSERGGWISFAGAGTVEYQVEADASGNLSGYAWSEKIGWININDAGDLYGAATGDSSAYCDDCEPCNPPVVYWSFDTGYGLTAYDESPRGNNINNDGTITGAAWQDASQCAAGKCLFFNGAGDYVSRAYDADLSFNDNGFSVGAWFKATAAGASSTLAARYDTAGWKLWLDASGNACFGIDDDADWGGENPDDRACTSGANYADNGWHYAFAVKDGTSALRLYMDGFIKASDLTLAAAGSLSGSGPALFAGVDSDGASADFKGFIDEFKIYSYARSAQQIKEDYAAGLAGLGTAHGVSAAFGSASDKWLSDGLVGYWKMDEAATTSGAFDSSGNGNTGTYYGNASTTGGKYGNGGSFASSTIKNYVDTVDLDLSEEFCLSMWVKPQDQPFDNGYGCMIGNINGDTSQYLCFADSYKFAFGIGSYWLNTDANYHYNNWYYLTYTRSLTKEAIYVDGNVKNTRAVASPLSGGTHKLIIGVNSGTGAFQFNGQLDEVRIYNRALSADEVRKLYEWAPGPVAHWQMDEKQGSTAYDSAASTTFSGGNHGTINGASWYPLGKFGNALRFDGANDYVSVADSDNFDFAGNFLFSGWVKTNDISTMQTVVGKLHSGGGGPGYYWRISGSSIVVMVTDGVNSVNPVYNIDSSVANNSWHYIAISVDKSKTQGINVYVDGVNKGCSSNCSYNLTTISSTANDLKLGIGSRNGTDAGFYLKNGLDDVRIYNYARTQKQILEDMSGGGGLYPLAEWKFDEGKGTTVYDSGVPAKVGGSGQKNLTMSSSTRWTLDGHDNKAYAGLDNQRVYDNADDNDLDFASTTDFTVSAWLHYSANNPAATQYILDKHDDAGYEGYALYMDSAGRLGFGVSDTSSASFPEDAALSTADWADNTWHHVLGRKTGNAKIELFVDGELVASDSALAANDNLANGATLYIGDNNATDGTDEFLGAIDDVKIYPYALNEDEIKQDYNSGFGAVMGAAGKANSAATSSNAASLEYCVPGSTDYCAAPVGEWKMDEKTGATMNDTSGNGFNGIFTNSPAWTLGKLGSGLSFGIGNYVTIADNASLRPGTGDYTAQLWIKIPFAFSGNPDWPNIFTKGYTTSAPANTWGFVGESTSVNKIRYYQTSDAGGTSDASLSSGTLSDGWHFVTARRSGTTAQLYIDGQFVVGDSSAGSNLSTNHEIFIGGNHANATYLIGSLDQIKYYNYARTPAQIAYDFNRGKPIAHWRFDECKGGTINDSAKSWNGGTANNGTLHLGTSDVTATGTCASSSSSFWYNGRTGKYNSAGSFDGEDDYVDVPKNISVTQMSISAWIYHQTNSGNNFIVANFETENEWYFDTYTSTDVSLQWYFASQEHNLLYNFSNNTWYHVVGTYDGSRVKLYVNGVLGYDVSETDPIGITAVKSIGAGKIETTPDHLFEGLIDEVKIFNYALTAEQVKSEYNGGAVRFGN